MLKYNTYVQPAKQTAPPHSIIPQAPVTMAETFQDIILEDALSDRILRLARSVKNTARNRAPRRHTAHRTAHADGPTHGRGSPSRAAAFFSQCIQIPFTRKDTICGTSGTL